MADGRPRHQLRRRDPAGRRHRPAGSELHHGQASRAARPGPDPCARGPLRGDPLSLGRPALPDLVHRVHGRGAAAQARGAQPQGRAGPRRGAGRALHGRRLRLLPDPDHPFDPRSRTRSPSARRSATSCTPATGSSIRRRWSAPTATIDAARGVRPGGRAGHGRGFDQCPDARHLGLRGRGARQPDAADRPADHPGGADHLRLQHRPPRYRDQGRPRARPRALRGRPLDAPHARGRARGRLPAGRGAS